MKKYNILISVIVILSISCDKETKIVDPGPKTLIGYWIDSEISDTITTYIRSDAFDEEKAGFFIRQDSTLQERKIDGWCGTPPVSYANYDGTITKVHDSLFSVTVGYWGGTTTYYLQIVKLTPETLKFVRVFAEN